ncbi:AN1-type zinc finger protein 2A isoform X2 [Moschus berezovskii]|uniref:AN1-type zinc finger protein 2A isoform X2 n=1 Tax=Moschus berezovskii TaxID=68408 RepID=UPI002444ADE0|nr:AN1-type zinc finger protein 2A isoform X2 [Moschus berezovskii]
MRVNEIFVKITLPMLHDVRVPVCPLCNRPVPVKNGEIPDVAVGAHMDGDCRRPPRQEMAKVFTFRCSREGCRRREMLQVVCEECSGSFCFQHRHPLDHGCARRGLPSSSARCLDPGPSGASHEGPGGWLARRFRYSPGQVGGTVTRRGSCLADQMGEGVRQPAGCSVLDDLERCFTTGV